MDFGLWINISKSALVGNLSCIGFWIPLLGMWDKKKVSGLCLELLWVVTDKLCCLSFQDPVVEKVRKQLGEGRLVSL